MKTQHIHSLPRGNRSIKQVILLSILALSLTGLHLQAAHDIASAKNGAAVIYTSPLNKGVDPQSLLYGKPLKNPFASSTGPQTVVIDLGKSYKITDIGKLPAGAHAYLLGSKPTAPDTWDSLVAGMDPNSPVDGLVGEYLVIVYDTPPPRYHGLLVDGDARWLNDGSIPGAGFGLGNSYPLTQTPLPKTDYTSR